MLISNEKLNYIFQTVFKIMQTHFFLDEINY